MLGERRVQFNHFIDLITEADYAGVSFRAFMIS